MTTEESHKIHVQRTFRAPRAQVFAALTDAEIHEGMQEEMQRAWRSFPCRTVVHGA